MLIAEISSNHNKSLSRCLEFITSAKDCGFDAVKFQLFKIDSLFTPEVLASSPMHRDRRNWEFPLEFLKPISEHCKLHKIQLGITPFYIEAVEESRKFIDFYKVASYELLWTDLHRAIIKHDIPTIVSTGMANLEEIKSVYHIYKSSQFNLNNLTFLHCESTYPASYATVNLKAIETLKHDLKCPIGWSDHTKDIDVICHAITAFGVETVEMHFDLDGTGDEAKGGHCWLPEDVKKLMKKIAKCKKMIGDGSKQPATTEVSERLWRADPSDGLRPMKAIRGNLNL